MVSVANLVQIFTSNYYYKDSICIQHPKCYGCDVVQFGFYHELNPAIGHIQLDMGSLDL